MLECVYTGETQIEECNLVIYKSLSPNPSIVYYFVKHKTFPFSGSLFYYAFASFENIWWKGTYFNLFHISKGLWLHIWFQPGGASGEVSCLPMQET